MIIFSKISVADTSNVGTNVISNKMASPSGQTRHQIQTQRKINKAPIRSVGHYQACRFSSVSKQNSLPSITHASPIEQVNRTRKGEILVRKSGSTEGFSTCLVTTQVRVRRRTMRFSRADVYWHMGTRPPCTEPPPKATEGKTFRAAIRGMFGTHAS